MTPAVRLARGLAALEVDVSPQAQEKLLAASPLLRAERTLDWWHKRDAQGQPRARSRQQRRLGARDDPAG